MINYTKSEVKETYNRSLIRINLLYGVCLFCILLYLIHLFGFFYLSNLPDGMTAFSYAAATTGSYIILFSILLPVILFFYKRSIRRSYKEEMKQSGEILYYSGDTVGGSK